MRKLKTHNNEIIQNNRISKIKLISDIVSSLHRMHQIGIIQWFFNAPFNNFCHQHHHHHLIIYFSIEISSMSK